MIFYFWIDLAGQPNIEVNVTTDSYETLVFYLDVGELDMYINALKTIIT